MNPESAQGDKRALMWAQRESAVAFQGRALWVYLPVLCSDHES